MQGQRSIIGTRRSGLMGKGLQRDKEEMGTGEGGEATGNDWWRFPVGEVGTLYKKNSLAILIEG
eukprot:scaffold2069_cov187-Amphora_coffeaeformis.AAC.14